MVPSAKYLAASRSTPRQQEVLSHFGSSAPRSGASIRRQCAAYENRASTARPAALGKVLEDLEQATGVGSGPVETRA
ncbi:hypothetical protein CP969_02600 [Streptomyces viridosporus T7A]|uniref:DUF4158 domain-containing protein n=1 Tax=Streptomyces viridosporus T7A TaxID=665577 RepID=A0ABX6A7P6_STRVD|nr:hypothetical protein CP969_02600 [Streptomyces viridosporus T7A]